MHTQNKYSRYIDNLHSWKLFKTRFLLQLLQKYREIWGIGAWLSSSCCSSLAEHWWLEAGVQGLSLSDYTLFSHFITLIFLRTKTLSFSTWFAWFISVCLFGCSAKPHSYVQTLVSGAMYWGLAWVTCILTDHKLICGLAWAVHLLQIKKDIWCLNYVSISVLITAGK